MLHISHQAGRLVLTRTDSEQLRSLTDVLSALTPLPACTWRFPWTRPAPLLPAAVLPSDQRSSPWEGTKGRVWFSAAGTQLKVHSFTEMTKQSARVPLPLQVASYS